MRDVVLTLLDVLGLRPVNRLSKLLLALTVAMIVLDVIKALR